MPPRLQSIRQFVWGEIPSSKVERSLLLKIDWFILSYCCLMISIEPNVNNAYVSGMKQELNMQGNDFNKINTIFTCGYIVGMIPRKIWFPLMQIVWGLYAIRFFQGMSEASTFVGTHYILGSWYKPGELGKRSGIFTSSGLAGTLHLGGVDGRSGWRWLFIMDGVITLPIAFYGFFVFPDIPATTKAFYLTNEERLLSYSRLEPDQDVVRHPLSWNLVRRITGRWRWYGCSLLFAISGETESFGSNNLMGQWLSAIGGYSVEQIDYYPSGVTAFGIVSTLVCATWTDYTRARWPVLVYMCFCCTIAAICILVWSSPTGLKFFAYYIAGASYSGQATTFAWANQICADDDQERAIVLASMNMWNNALLFYPATDAPRFRKGMIAMLCMCAATLGVTWLVWFLDRRDRRRLVDGEEDKLGMKQRRSNTSEEGEREK
ncbi:major facilitator superfamily domain-containing protein [Melanogaster broomeanus]|nr:major facilitator superfamily domain-containing protein [Melanogaster broomeanus]